MNLGAGQPPVEDTLDGELPRRRAHRAQAKLDFRAVQHVFFAVSMKNKSESAEIAGEKFALFARRF